MTSGGVGNGTAGTRDMPVGADAGTDGNHSQAGSAGTNAGGSSGGGASTGLPRLVDGCADLDSDGVADCSVTLAKNPAFEKDVTNWSALDGATLTWDTDNALADTPSGCARLRPRDPPDARVLIYRAAQCVPVQPNRIIIAFANARVDSAAGAMQLVHAELEVSYFDNPDCSGKSSGYFATPPSEASSKWVTIQAGGVSGPATTAVSVALLGIRPETTSDLNVCFDNVMIKAKPLP